LVSGGDGELQPVEQGNNPSKRAAMGLNI